MDFRRCYGCYGWCKSVARRLRLTFMVPKSYVRSNSGIKFAELTLQLFIKGWNIHPIKSRFVKSWHTFLKSQILNFISRNDWKRKKIVSFENLCRYKLGFLSYWTNERKCSAVGRFAVLRSANRSLPFSRPMSTYVRRDNTA